MSTLLAKCISRCAGVQVLHEPFTDSYYFSRQRMSSRYGEVQELPDQDACRYASLAGYGPGVTFVKELAFQGRPYVDDDLLRGATHAFLYRHPAAVVRSLQGLKPDFTEDELGFTALEALHERVRLVSGRPATLLNGDEFRSSPEAFLRSYCKNNQLPFSESMLTWEPGPLREWKAHESQSQRKWHQRLEASRGIIPSQSVDLTAPPIADPSQRSMYRRALEIFGRFEQRRESAESGHD